MAQLEQERELEAQQHHEQLLRLHKHRTEEVQAQETQMVVRQEEGCVLQ